MYDTCYIVHTYDMYVCKYYVVVPLAMRSLVIVENCDRHQYRRVRGSGWDRPSIKVGDYDLVGRQT